jgi:hypothetical protein
MSTKTKNIVLLAIISTTFILSIASYATQQQQVFAQDSLQSERNQTPFSASPLITEEEVITEEEQEPEENEPGLANQSTTEEDQKIILGGITIPLKSNTQLSLEMPDSKITVEPIK